MDPKANNQLLKAFFNAIPLQDASDFKKTADLEKYVAGLHSSDARDPIDELAQSIDFNLGAATYLFTGHRGSGKTVELKRLALRLEAEFDCTALYVDMGEFISLTDALWIGDLITAAMGALSEAFDARYSDNRLQESYWTRLAIFLSRTAVEMPELKIGAGLPAKLASMDLKLALKTNPSFKQQVQKFLDARLDDFVFAAREFADEIVGEIRDREQSPARKVVLIVDSLERVRGAGDKAHAVYRSFRETFHDNAASLRSNTLHVVYSVPPILPLIASGIGTLYSGGLCGLPQVKVNTTPSRTGSAQRQFEPGLSSMVSLINRRFRGGPKCSVSFN